MSTNSKISNSGAPIIGAKQEERRGIRSIMWLGLAPVALLSVTGILVMALVALIRHLIDPINFFLQQQIFLMIMLTGLTLAIIVYTLAMTRALKRIETWRRHGYTTKATAGLVVVTIVSVIVVLPVILTLFFH